MQAEIIRAAEPDLPAMTEPCAGSGSSPSSRAEEGSSFCAHSGAGSLHAAHRSGGVQAGCEEGESENASIVLEQLQETAVRDSMSLADTMVFNPRSLKFTFFCNEPKLNAWFPDRIEFWRSEGRAIAWRNLLVSQLNLMVAFAVWLMWSILVVRMQKAHDIDPTRFSFGFVEGDDLQRYKGKLYLLPALAGLSGGTFRITNSFMILPVGGRLCTTLTALLLMIPCGVSSWELSKETPQFDILAAAAMLSGIGGGAFASSMSNISYFYPGRSTGLALGLNGGIGNLGVSLTQIMIPLLISGFGAIFANSGGDAKIEAVEVIHGSKNEKVWVGALFWVPFCGINATAAWLWLNDMPHHGNGSLGRRIYYYVCMEGAACAASAVASSVFLATATFSPSGQLGQTFLMVLVATLLAHFFLYVVSPNSDLREKMSSQMVIFKSPHTYVMSWLYVVCFGTFIGFSSSFPKLIQDIFGYIKCPNVDTGVIMMCPNPNAPPSTMYAFLGPLLGALVRPFGGWLSDKFGGAVVTQIYIGIMTGSAVGIGLVVQRATAADKPEDYFAWFLVLFLLLFATSGISNGSTFKQVSQVFRAQGVGELVGPVLGWSSALASFGAFVVPSILGVAIAENKVAVNMFGFAGYYLFCFLLNFWFYLRPGKGKCSMSGAAGCHSMIGAVSVNAYMNKDQGLCDQCGGVRHGSTSMRSDKRMGVTSGLRPSLNHLDAEPCICDVIKVFRQQHAGHQFAEQKYNPNAAGKCKTCGGLQADHYNHSNGKWYCGIMNVGGAVTPLNTRQKEKIEGWFAASKPPGAGASCSARSCKSGVSYTSVWSGGETKVNTQEGEGESESGVLYTNAGVGEICGGGAWEYDARGVGAMEPSEWRYFTQPLPANVVMANGSGGGESDGGRGGFVTGGWGVPTGGDAHMVPMTVRVGVGGSVCDIGAYEEPFDLADLSLAPPLGSSAAGKIHYNLVHFLCDLDGAGGIGGVGAVDGGEVDSNGGDNYCLLGEGGNEVEDEEAKGVKHV